MAEGTEVGKAYVSLEANSAGLDAGLKQAEARVDTFAASSDKATARASGGFSKLGKGIKDTIKPLTSLIGGVTAAVGTFGLFVSLGERLGRTIFGLDSQGRTKQEALIEESSDVAKSLLMKASGLKGPDPTVEAAKDKLDEKIMEREETLRQYIESNARAGGPIGRQDTTEVERELSDLRDQRRRITDAEYRISRMGGAAAPFVPSAMTGVFAGGDPHAVLRVLQDIRSQGQRRGVDE